MVEVTRLFGDLLKGLPESLLDEVKNYVIYQPQTNQDLRDAVDMWCVNRNEALEKYGHISLWDTHKITDMTFLFIDQSEFNDDIGDWDVSNVTDMFGMFQRTGWGLELEQRHQNDWYIHW